MIIKYGTPLLPSHDAKAIVDLVSEHVNTNYSRSRHNVTNPNFGNAMGFDINFIDGKRMLVCVNRQYDPLVDKQNMDNFINWCNSFLVGVLSIEPFQLLSETQCFSVTNYLEVIPGQLHVAPGYPGTSIPMFFR